MEAPILEGPRGQIPYLSYPDLDRSVVRPPLARRGLPFRPYLHARISRITVVEQLPQISIAIVNIRAAGAGDRELGCVGIDVLSSFPSVFSFRSSSSPSLFEGVVLRP